MKLVYTGFFLNTVAGIALAATAACPTATLVTTGCSQVDMRFSNIALGTETGWPNSPTTSDIDFAGSGGVISGSPSTIQEIDATITSPNASSAPGSLDGWYSSNKNTATGTGSVSFLATANNGTSGSAPVTPAGAFWILTSLDLIINPGAYATTNVAITVTEQFCLNGTAIGGCAAAALGNITATIGPDNASPSYTWSIDGSAPQNANTINLLTAFAGHVTTVFVNDEVSIPKSDGTTFLNNFSDGFDQEETTPEPSSMSLLGSALAMIAVSCYRRVHLKP